MINGGRIIALDGHDGVGKTTLAKMLAESLGWTYARPYAGSIGSQLLTLSSEGQYKKASELALEAVNRIIEENQGKLVFDRHWMTVFTLIPLGYIEYWMPLPKTILLYSSMEETMRRLDQREEQRESVKHHTYYINKYLQLADKYGCIAFNTDGLTAEESLEKLLPQIIVDMGTVL